MDYRSRRLWILAASSFLPVPGREWYKHLIYAPGMLTGYGVKTLPGVRESIETSKWEEANEYSTITAAALGAYCDRLDRATALLKQGT
jgi:N-acetylated-alpha-linked acidic dipeptidase